jgi:hypothetical protein
MILNGVPSSLIRDGGDDTSVQYALRIDEFWRERKIDGDTIGVALRNVELQIIFEGH